MFTKNYQIYRERMFRGGSTSATLTLPSRKTVTFSAGSGGSYLDIGYYLGYAATSSVETATASASYPYSANHCGVVFGSGTTPATINDVNLENRITSGLSVTFGGLNLGNVEGKHYCAWCSFTVTNTSGAELTIGEVGILTNHAVVSGSNCSQSAVLMERTVLDEPVTIAPGGQKIVTYKIDFYH